MRTEFISANQFPAKVAEADKGHRLVKMALVASNWNRGRTILESVPGGDGHDTFREFNRATVRVLPGPGCIHADFIDQNLYDEVYVVPDGISLVDMHQLTKLLLGKK